MRVGSASYRSPFMEGGTVPWGRGQTRHVSSHAEWLENPPSVDGKFG